MNCKNCGSSLKENIQFCENCGAKVNGKTNYGPAPENSGWKLMLILVGSTLIGVAIVILIAQVIENKKYDNSAKISREKSEIVANSHEEDEEYESDDVAVKSTKDAGKSIYTVESGDFSFEIPTNLICTKEYDDDRGVEFITIEDEENNWIASMGLLPGTGAYENLLKNKNYLKAGLIEDGASEVSDAVEKNIGGIPVIVFEFNKSGQKAIAAYAKYTSTSVFAITIVNKDNKYDYNALEKIAKIISTAEYND